jgi:hypothetical protein
LIGEQIARDEVIAHSLSVRGMPLERIVRLIVMGRRIGVDAKVVEADVHYPALAERRVRTLTRTIKKDREALLKEVSLPLPLRRNFQLTPPALSGLKGSGCKYGGQRSVRVTAADDNQTRPLHRSGGSDNWADC